MEPIGDIHRETCDEELMMLYSFTCTGMQEISTLPTPPIQNSNFSKGEFRFFFKSKHSAQTNEGWEQYIIPSEKIRHRENETGSPGMVSSSSCINASPGGNKIGSVTSSSFSPCQNSSGTRRLCHSRRLNGRSGHPSQQQSVPAESSCPSESVNSQKKDSINIQCNQFKNNSTYHFLNTRFSQDDLLIPLSPDTLLFLK
jgi:hypothetical protein